MRARGEACAAQSPHAQRSELLAYRRATRCRSRRAWPRRAQTGASRRPVRVSAWASMWIAQAPGCGPGSCVGFMARTGAHGAPVGQMPSGIANGRIGCRAGRACAGSDPLEEFARRDRSATSSPWRPWDWRQFVVDDGSRRSACAPTSAAPWAGRLRRGGSGLWSPVPAHDQVAGLEAGPARRHRRS
jgi:hypothetical protein